MSYLPDSTKIGTSPELAMRIGDTLFNVLDPSTGELVSYNKTTTWIDGHLMDDSHTDESLYIKVGNDYFVREHEPGFINVLWLGLKNDNSINQNEIILNKIISRLPISFNITFFFPKGIYHFDKLSSDYDAFERSCCVRLQGQSFTFLGEDGTVLSAASGTSMFNFINGVPRVKNMTITAKGMDNMDGRLLDGNGQPLYPIDSPLAWNTGAGEYKHAGINCFAQGEIHNVTISGFSGNGMFIFGDPGTYIPYPPKELSGTKAGNVIILDYPTDTYFIPNSGVGSTITINGHSGIPLGGVYYPEGQLIPHATAEFINIPNGHYTFKVYCPGAGTIADNGQITGLCNFDGNGACGLFIAGADGNQWSIVGLSCRENGNWGVHDISFLGTHFFGCHGSANGKRFRTSPEASASSPYGAFACTNANARSTFIGCYTEEGNQGPDLYTAPCLVLGGIHAAGINPASTGFVFSNDGVFPGLTFGSTSIRDKGLDFNFDNQNWRFGLLRGDEYDNDPAVRQDVLGFSRNLYNTGRGILDLHKDGHVHINSLFVGKYNYEEIPVGLSVNNLSQLPEILDRPVLQGTKIHYLGAKRNTHSGWICTGGGVYKSIVTIQITQNGPTAETQGPTIYFPLHSSFISNGIRYKIVDLNTASNRVSYYTFPEYYGGTANATTALPEWTAEGTGKGLLSERPAASIDLAGMLYYAIDTKLNYYCDGSTWQ